MAPELALVETGAGPEAALTWLEPIEPTDSNQPDSGVSRAWRLRFARLGPDGWSEVSTVAGSVTGAGDEGAELFANWADRPGAVQARPRSGARSAPVFAYWLAKNGDSTYAYTVQVARSDDGGGSWRDLGRIHSDETAAEHGFVSAVPEQEGVRAFWLDGRATPGGGPMTLRTVRIGDSIERSTEELLDDSVCDCCNTTAVLAEDGPLVVYRDRTADEIRDPWLVRRTGTDGKGLWSDPEPLHRDGWAIPACPVNGPAAGRLSDTVWVVWYTAEGGRARVLAAVSNDGGESFGDPIAVDEPDASGDGAPLGRLDLAVDPAGRGDAVLSWLDSDSGDAVIRLRRLSADGSLGPPVTVARTADSRASGVPRLLALPGVSAVSSVEAGASDGSGTRLLVSWVDPGQGVRLASLAAAAVPSS